MAANGATYDRGLSVYWAQPLPGSPTYLRIPTVPSEPQTRTRDRYPLSHDVAGAVAVPADPAPSGATLNYRMRGYRPGHLPAPDFEYWNAIGTPSTVNPSGEPIQDIIAARVWLS